MSEIIKTEQLTFAYSGEDNQTILALDGIDMSVEKGEFVAVLGHNGSGKSTLAKQFNAILLPSGGSVYVKGMNTRDEALIYDIRRTVGMVSQNPDNQIVATVVEEDVAFAPENMGLPQAEIRRRVDGALSDVGMLEFKEHAPHLLSGGQKQRIAIAGIFAMRPECIVLDEPTAMLDPVGREEVIHTIHELNREHGVTTILITHNMTETIDADRVIVMNNGKIVMSGKPKEIFQRVEELFAVDLGVPPTVELLYQLRKAGFDVAIDKLSVEECTEEIKRFLEA